MEEEYTDKNSRPKITYGMMLEGFRSLPGVPDDFYSAEDPADRIKLWEEHLKNQETTRI